jgi:hypothetical protein
MIPEFLIYQSKYRRRSVFMDSYELEQLRETIREVVREELELGYVPMGDRWLGGKVIIEPRDTSLQSKELPIDRLFHKIIMVRDRLRVLEQKINTSKKLDEKDKVELQQYITRCYGSLTSFNNLFREKEDAFRGESSKD